MELQFTKPGTWHFVSLNLILTILSKKYGYYHLYIIKEDAVAERGEAAFLPTCGRARV